MSIIWMLLAPDDVINFGKIKFTFLHSGGRCLFSLLCCLEIHQGECPGQRKPEKRCWLCVRVAVDTSMYRASVVEAWCVELPPLSRSPHRHHPCFLCRVELLFFLMFSFIVCFANDRLSLQTLVQPRSSVRGARTHKNRSPG